MSLSNWMTLGESCSLSEPQILHLDGTAALRMAPAFSLCIAFPHGTKTVTRQHCRPLTSLPTGIPSMTWIWSQPDLGPNPGFKFITSSWLYGFRQVT